MGAYRSKFLPAVTASLLATLGLRAVAVPKRRFVVADKEAADIVIGRAGFLGVTRPGEESQGQS